MIDSNTILNVCYIAPDFTSLVFYSHIIPIVLSLVLGIFVFVKSKFNFFSKIFLSFVVIVSMWLVGNLITWISTNYNLIYTIWSYLVFLEIIFYVLGLYFVIVFARKSDIHFWFKVIIFLITIPVFLITINQQSVTGFNYPTCEALNNNFLDNYKLAFEAIILFVILMYTINPLFRKISWKEKWPKLVVLGSMFLFLSIFGITEYLGAATGNYEMNLYSLFLLPIFLVAIIYSVFELDIFNVKILGSHYLVVGLIILMAGQLFFIADTANRILTIIAIIIAGVISIILFRNIKKESDQRTQIAKLNVDLNKLIEQRESLVHLVTHKVKGSFTRSKYIFAGILDGTFGEISPEIRKFAQTGLDSDNLGISTVDLVLNADNLQRGVIRYKMQDIDFKELVVKLIEEKRIPIEAKGLKLESVIQNGNYNISGDNIWVKEAVNNLIENSIRYTKKGDIKINLESVDGKIKFKITDTGIGITAEDKKNLFTQGGRGKDSVKINVDSTGYGLYSVKLIVESHKGKVWAESEGEGKGSTFYIELPAISTTS
jgi:signal transduction histidine kinase